MPGYSPITKSLVRGFTVVETLTASAVIVVLAALLFPAAKGVWLRGIQASCLANLRSYGLVVLSYAAENDGLPRYKDEYDGNVVRKIPPNFSTVMQAYTSGKLPRCPLKGGETYSFHYTVNACLSLYYPRLLGVPVPAERTVLAAENSNASDFNDQSHFNRTIWAAPIAQVGPDVEGTITSSFSKKPQYHGSPNKRGLHFFMLDGHAALVFPSLNANGDPDWRMAPVYGPMNTFEANQRKAQGIDLGYFYDQRHFMRMPTGELDLR